MRLLATAEGISRESAEIAVNVAGEAGRGSDPDQLVNPGGNIDIEVGNGPTLDRLVHWRVMTSQPST